MAGRTSVSITRYAVDDDVNSSDEQFNILGGATLVFLGDDSLTDDAVSGAGRVSVRGPTTISSDLLLVGTTLFVNTSTVMQIDDRVEESVELGLSSDDSVTVRNIAGATWTLDDAYISYVDTGSSSQFVNLGLIDQIGGFAQIYSNFYDRGGTIQINDSLTFEPPGSDRFVNDTITGAGDLEVYGSIALVDSNLSAQTTEIEDIRVVGDVVDSSQIFTALQINLGVGSILSLTNADVQMYLGGRIYGAGTIEIVNGGNYRDGGSFGGNGTLDLVGKVTFENYGNTIFGSQFDGGGAEVTPWTDDQITIVNEAGAIWTDGGSETSIFQQTNATGSSAFVNDGDFVEGAVIDVKFNMAVVNNGTMQFSAQVSRLTPPSMAFDDAVTGVGSIDVTVVAGTPSVTADGGTVTFAGSVAGGQTLIFAPTPTGSPDPTLAIDSPQQFAGLISGFDQGGATDDQLIFTTSTWQYRDFVASGSGTGGALMFSDGSAETAVDLTGSYDPNGFRATVLGGKTTITYSG